MVYVLGREVLEELLGVKEEVFLAACALALGGKVVVCGVVDASRAASACRGRCGVVVLSVCA